MSSFNPAVLILWTIATVESESMIESMIILNVIWENWHNKNMFLNAILAKE